MRSRILLGAMSGTSVDGVDVAVTRVSGRGERMKAGVLALAQSRFSPALAKRIRAMRATGVCRLQELAQIGRELALVYAWTCRTAMRAARVEADQVAAIAAHGQTLFHAPPLTIQWLDPSLLACELGIAVISDFRRADCGVGGQGAPLVPFADWLLFCGARHGRVLLNIGGIANITYVPPGAGQQDVVALDTGPGNCISDAIVQEELGLRFDRFGRRAALGMPDHAAVARFLGAEYFRRKLPKTTDGPEMLALFGSLRGIAAMSVEDRLATACLCTARSIALAIRALPRVDEIILAGGGAENRTIMRMLIEETGVPIRTTGDFGIPTSAREAVAFALLGAATLDGLPSNMPSVTGARRPVVLGSICRPDQQRAASGAAAVSGALSPRPRCADRPRRMRCRPGDSSRAG